MGCAVKNKKTLGEQLTIVVNSCDAYEDLWTPFFVLLKKYWNPTECQILLNTESRTFSFPGLNIECVHTGKNVAYGKRMLNMLARVKTKYILLLLDDFFLRSKVEQSRIEQILEWMEADRNIVCFNCDPNVCYADWEVNKYPGFRRMPPGNSYVLSLQAAIWRTDRLKKYWRPDVNPWEWEELCSIQTARYPKEKFYCLNKADDTFLDYGHRRYGGIWGVYRGKWVVDDVGPLFEKEEINVDYSVRGTYTSDERRPAISVSDDRKSRYSCVARCLGKREVFRYFVFCRCCNIMRRMGKAVNYDYFRFLQNRVKRKFLNSFEV